MTTIELQTAREQIARAKRVLVVTHISPDGDAIGSLLGFGLAVRNLGKEVVMACADVVPELFRYLPAVDEITLKPNGSFDLVVVLDVAEARRMGPVGEQLARLPDLVFDHHVTNPGFGLINFIDPQAASTAELLTELLEPLGLALTPEVAECLLTGLVTDTLGFRTSNTTVKTLGLAQTLMRAGADLQRVYDLSLFKRSYSAVRLWAEGLARLQMKHRIVWARLPLEARAASGYQGFGDADLINVLTSVREADVAVIFVERTDGKVKISWRSVPGINVAQVAMAFGGGGHAAAAGAEIAGTMEEVEKLVLDATRAAIKASQQLQRAVAATPPA
jgi:bifunctional oligoribonuclease and PAP phosphatase NrnA